MASERNNNAMKPRGKTMQKIGLSAGLCVLAVLIVSGTESALYEGRLDDDKPAALGKGGFGPATYDEVLKQASQNVSYHRDRVSQARDEWLRHEGLARSLHRRSQLTGSFEDLAEANEHVLAGRALAPPGSGPLLTWASIAMSSHDLDQSEAALDALDSVAVPPRPETASEIAALRGDLQYYRGDPVAAALAYRDAEQLSSSAGTAIRLARLAKANGAFETAQSWFAKAGARASSATPYLMAGLGLQIGAVDLARGEYDAALKLFEEANQTLPGHWLIEAHLAQSKALEGDLDGAIAEMRQLAERTQSPDLMDSLANMLRASGHDAESREWITRSSAIWERRMKRLPEAAIGHALEHELAFGSPERAVELARLNLAIRPYGAAHLLMAQAFRKAGQFDRAHEHIEAAKSSDLRSAALYAAESEILTVLGNLDRARAARQKAKALNPRIFDPETAFIWFSHG